MDLQIILADVSSHFSEMPYSHLVLHSRQCWPNSHKYAWALVVTESGITKGCLVITKNRLNQYLKPD
jgi:hypothetical protein